MLTHGLIWNQGIFAFMCNYPPPHSTFHFYIFKNYLVSLFYPTLK